MVSRLASNTISKIGFIKIFTENIPPGLSTITPAVSKMVAAINAEDIATIMAVKALIQDVLLIVAEEQTPCQFAQTALLSSTSETFVSIRSSVAETYLLGSHQRFI